MDLPTGGAQGAWGQASRQGCSRRGGASKAGRQAVGGGCQAVGGGYYRLQMPLRLALGVRGQWLGVGWAPWRAGGGTPPPFQCIPASHPDSVRSTTDWRQSIAEERPLPRGRGSFGRLRVGDDPPARPPGGRITMQFGGRTARSPGHSLGAQWRRSETDPGMPTLFDMCPNALAEMASGTTTVTTGSAWPCFFSC